MNEAIALSFTAGLLGGAGHCAGMCGPLAASYALLRDREGGGLMERALPHLLYNTGRITTYTLIGGLMGFTGSFAAVASRMAGVQSAAGVLAGIFMVVMGLGIAGLHRGAQALEARGPALLAAVGPVLEAPGAMKFYPLGLALGFLPCGLSYTIFIGAAASGGPLAGMAMAMAFGIGTLPAMMAVGLTASYIGSRARGIIYRMGGLAVVLMGCLFIARGVAACA